jgi:hypothetical protein
MPSYYDVSGLWRLYYRHGAGWIHSRSKADHLPREAAEARLADLRADPMTALAATGAVIEPYDPAS